MILSNGSKPKKAKFYKRRQWVRTNWKYSCKSDNKKQEVKVWRVCRRKSLGNVNKWKPSTTFPRM